MVRLDLSLCLLIALFGCSQSLGNSDGKLVFRPLMHQPRIYQGAPAGVHVTTIHAYDPDKPRNKVDYSLPHILDKSHFEVDSFSGNLTTATVIEKSVGETYQVMIAAVSYDVSELEHIQIAVTEFNQFAPRFQQEVYKVDLPRLAPINTTVLRVKAFDPDPVPLNAEVYYRMDQNPASTFFHLDPLTGVLTTSQFMNTTGGILRFGIFAEDGGSPKRWSHVQVEIVLRAISAPGFITIVDVTISSATLCWRLPEYGDVTGYVVTYKTEESEHVSTVNVTSHDLDTCEKLSNLEDDTEYEVQILAWNPEDIGAISDVHTFKTNVNHCRETPCNSGNCETTESWPFYYCTCQLGYYGSECEFFDPCSTAPCGNNGSCVNTTHNEFVCVCTEDYMGPNCGSYNPCSKKKLCKNGGTCQVTTDHSYICICPPSFLGRKCELEDLCYSNLCQNGASCSYDAGNSTRCICPPGLTGQLCESDVDECTPNPCRNGSTCFNHKDGFSCICQAGFSGKYCSIEEQCPPDRTDDDYGNMYWIASFPNVELSLKCPYGSVIENGNALRKCMLSNITATWGPVNTSQCKSKDFLVADEIADELDILTANATTLDLEKLTATSEGVAKLSTMASKDPKLAQGMINVISNVMNADLSLIEDEENQNISESLLQIVDDFASQVPLQLGEAVHVDAENLRVATVGWHSNDTSESNEVVALESPVRSQRFPPQTMMQVIVPHEALQKAQQKVDKDVRVKFVVYYNDKFFRTRIPETEKSSSSITPVEKFPVIDISIDNISLTNLSSPLIYIFPTITNLSARCVYWNESHRLWSSEGLTTNHTEQNVICKSSHLTAFSVLLDPTPIDELSEVHEEALSFISYVGCGLSLFGLFLTLLTYSLFRCLNRDRQGKILLNLCSSLLMLNMSFLLGAFKPQFGDYTCAVVALMVHYFLLASLSWMCVEAVNMYQLLIHVFATSETHFLLRRCLGAWGGPLIIVGLTAAFGLQEYFSENDFCMLSPHNPWIYYMAFLAPSCIILLINLSIFILVSRVLFTPRLTTEVVFKCKPHEASVTAAQVRGAFTVMILLGVTWIFGTVAVGSVKLIFQYIFCITNSLQGFLIFLVRCLLYPEARGAWLYFIKSGKLKKHRGIFPPVSFSTNSQMVKNVTLSTGAKSEGRGTSGSCDESQDKISGTEEAQKVQNTKRSGNNFNHGCSLAVIATPEEHSTVDISQYQVHLGISNCRSRNNSSGDWNFQTGHWNRDLRSQDIYCKPGRSASVDVASTVAKKSKETKSNSSKNEVKEKRSFSLDTYESKFEKDLLSEYGKEKLQCGFERQHPILEKEDSVQSDETSTSTDVDDCPPHSISYDSRRRSNSSTRKPC